jgi:hypothetical protein
MVAAIFTGSSFRGVGRVYDFSPVIQMSPSAIVGKWYSFHNSLPS